MWGRGLLVAAFLSSAVATPAQELSVVPDTSAILTVNQTRLFRETTLGRAMQATLNRRAEALSAENRVFEEELAAEELALTEERATLSPDAFRDLANAFDEKVVSIREAQDAKERALTEDADGLEERFQRQILPVLARLMSERGAVGLLDTRDMILAARTIEITDAAIAAVNAAFTEEVPDDAAVDLPARSSDPDAASTNPAGENTEPENDP